MGLSEGVKGDPLPLQYFLDMIWIFPEKTSQIQNPPPQISGWFSVPASSCDKDQPAPGARPSSAAEALEHDWFVLP